MTNGGIKILLKIHCSNKIKKNKNKTRTHKNISQEQKPRYSKSQLKPIFSHLSINNKPLANKFHKPRTRARIPRSKQTQSHVSNKPRYPLM